MVGIRCFVWSGWKRRREGKVKREQKEIDSKKMVVIVSYLVGEKEREDFCVNFYIFIIYAKG